MRDLVAGINRYAHACSTAQGIVQPPGHAGFEDLDAIVNDLDHCLYTIRVLDRDVFEASNRQAFSKLRTSSPEGGVVTALQAVRDAATHHKEVVDPNVVRALGPLERGSFIVFERWRQRSELPGSFFDNVDGKFHQARAAAYDDHVAGRYVLDTLFDAYKFFEAADPKLLPRVDGQIPGFPIPPLELVYGYYRIHPDWPTHEEAERAHRSQLGRQIPAGDRRRIVGSVRGGDVFVGWTEQQRGETAFTEPSRQVAIDVRNGFEYYVVMDDKPESVSLDGKALVVGGEKLTSAVPDATDDPEHPWADWATLAADDSTYYHRQRTL